MAECNKCGCTKEKKSDDFYPYFLYNYDGIESRHAPECSERFIPKPKFKQTVIDFFS